MLTVTELKGATTGFDPTVGKITVSFKYIAPDTVEIKNIEYQFTNDRIREFDDDLIIESAKSVISYCINTNEFHTIGNKILKSLYIKSQFNNEGGK